MRSREFDARRLDVAAFAAQGAALQGQWPVPLLERLAGSAHPEAASTAGAAVDWQARGEQRALRGGVTQTWLHLTAKTRLELVCQRCLQPLSVDIDATRSFLFVPGEETAAELDAESEDDVLALTRSLDLRELAEDELLLSLPLVPMHERCPLAWQARADEAAADEKPHPFAGLAALKGRAGGRQGGG